MYDNVLYQPAVMQLEQDIQHGTMPGALLFSGAGGNGTLTAALETARICACTESPRGEWQCGCPSCLRHKQLAAHTVLLLGTRECMPEIAASRQTLLRAAQLQLPHCTAARYLFMRSVRKLTMRFHPILWEGDDKVSKIAPLVAAIDEQLEVLAMSRPLPEMDDLEKCTAAIEMHAAQLAADWLPNSIPIRHIRNAACWAHMASTDGMKTCIIERADCMLEGARNALLKILEEPPAGVLFILTVPRRAALMPTICSRVRTYQFHARTGSQQHEIISRVFHDEHFSGTIETFFEQFLPVRPDVVASCAADFFYRIADNRLPSVEDVVKTCASFEPCRLFRMFLAALAEQTRALLFTPAGTAAATAVMATLEQCLQDVVQYNQTPASAIETLVRSLSKINRMHGGVFSCAVQKRGA
ncbi:MAG: DNA polymerase III [Treponema sp.]|nr:DNA polymerase III [Treponema sp.]